MTAYDETVAGLCEKVDYWKSQAEHWKSEYDKIREGQIESLDASIKDSQKCVVNVFRLVLSQSDDFLRDLIKAPDDSASK